MSGAGFEGGAYGSEWLSAWGAIGILGLILFLEYMFFVREDYAPFPFSFAGSLIGVLLCIILISLTGWTKLAFIIGILGTIGGGIVVGQMSG